jgi:DNA-directed RNA polymerase subunit M/transcription elongation factor TFIIS
MIVTTVKRFILNNRRIVRGRSLSLLNNNNNTTPISCTTTRCNFHTRVSFNQQHETTVNNNISEQQQQVEEPQIELAVNLEEARKITIAQIVPHMAAQFTCNKCQTRETYVFSKQSYEREVVIVQCRGCAVHHLIADNKGWFGEERNIEEILTKQGKSFRRVKDISEFHDHKKSHTDNSNSE